MFLLYQVKQNLTATIIFRHWSNGIYSDILDSQTVKTIRVKRVMYNICFIIIFETETMSNVTIGCVHICNYILKICFTRQRRDRCSIDS